MKNQPGTMKNHKNRHGTMKKKTWNTQHEKVLIFRDTRGVTTDLHDTWNEKVLIFCDTRGVTTDLLDV